MRRALLALLAASTAPGCATIGGKNARLAEERGAELSATQARAQALEVKLADLQKDNQRLTRRVAELESGLKVAQSAAARSAESASPAEPPALRASEQTEAVAAAPDPTRALSGGATPVQASPRLVQPTFASQEQTIFENEASGGVAMSSVLFGAHLASYRREADAQAGWRVLQSAYPSELSLLEPRLARVTVEGREVLRLVAGGFATSQKAGALCDALKKRNNRYCVVTSFDGEKLTN